MAEDAVFELNGVAHNYDQSGSHPALVGVSGVIKNGECLLIMGPSGSGKSTLLHILGLIEPLKEGDLRFLGTSVRGLRDKNLSELRRFKLGFIFQSFYLFDALTVSENIEYFLLKQKLPKNKRQERITGALAMVGLTEFRDKYPLALSGGQRQRVAIARALAKNPRVIIADEPTANLDQATAREIFTVFRNLAKSGVTIVMASHDPLAKEYVDRTIHLIDGQVKGGI